MKGNKYLHPLATIRRMNNKRLKINDEAGIWHIEHTDTAKTIVKGFQRRFTLDYNMQVYLY